MKVASMALAPLLLALVGCASLPETEAPTEVFNQSATGAMSCGPCAVYHALKFGPTPYREAAAALLGDSDEAKVRDLIANYAHQPSEDFPPPRARYDDKGGTTPNDLVAMVTDLFEANGLPAPKGVWLDRRKNEPATDLVRRLHAELSSSTLPPIIDVRSFIADVKDEGEGEPLWEGQVGHFMTVVDIDPLPPTGRVSGFLMRCADSVNGRIIPVFAAVERHRPFIATRGFTVQADGDEVWEWVYDSPYLLLTIPDLDLDTSDATWFERTTIALKWALVSPPADGATYGSSVVSQ